MRIVDACENICASLVLEILLRIESSRSTLACGVVWHWFCSLSSGLYERWSWIRSRVREDSAFFPEPESNIFEKPDPWSVLIIGQWQESVRPEAKKKNVLTKMRFLVAELVFRV